MKLYLFGYQHNACSPEVDQMYAMSKTHLQLLVSYFRRLHTFH